MPTGTFLIKYTFDNDDGADSSGNGLNLTLTNSPTFENTPGGSAAQISNINVAANCNASALVNFNTDVAVRAFIEYGTTKWAGFVYKDNISDYRACGVAGGGCNGSDATCRNGVFTGWVFTNNGIMRSAGVGPNYPTGQLWVTSWGSQLVNFNSGLDGNYRIASGSTWKNAATDGKDLGADIDGVERAPANSPTGNWPSP